MAEPTPAKVIAVWPCEHGNVLVEPGPALRGYACSQCGATASTYILIDEVAALRFAAAELVDRIDELGPNATSPQVAGAVKRTRDVLESSDAAVNGWTLVESGELDARDERVLDLEAEVREARKLGVTEDEVRVLAAAWRHGEDGMLDRAGAIISRLVAAADVHPSELEGGTTHDG